MFIYYLGRVLSMKLRLGLRKIQHVHGSSFICLPKAWIETHNLQKGDRVAVTLLDDGSLGISRGGLDG